MAIDVKRLEELELKYGGVHRAARRINSPKGRQQTGGDRGGDRMVSQRYAAGYAAVLPDTAEVIVEMGVFLGTGLALWKDLYPLALVIGLDLDTQRYRDNVPALEKLGAFKDSYPLVWEFDEFLDESWESLTSVLEPGSVDVWVDDADHHKDSIKEAFARAMYFMKPGGVYIAEDNAFVADELRELYPQLDIRSSGEDNRLTTIQL